MERDDVGVIQSRRGARLLLEAAQPLGIGGDLRGEHLDRDFPPEPRVASEVDLAHAARAKRPADLVGAEAGPGGQ